MRRPLPRTLLVALFLVFATSLASAQEQLASLTVGTEVFQSAALTPAVLFPATPVANTAEAAVSPLTNFRPSFDMRRPALLPAMYVATAALQALDAHSTLTALKGGAREANPMMAGVAHNKGALLAVKAGVAASTIYLAENMWKRNRVGAIVMMAVVNSVNAVVVAHNYKVASTPR
jgi:hypothetical protein